jgi:hypothetical protein
MKKTFDLQMQLFKGFIYHDPTMNTEGSHEQKTATAEHEMIEHASHGNESEENSATDQPTRGTLDPEGVREERVTAKAWLCVFVRST